MQAIEYVSRLEEQYLQDQREFEKLKERTGKNLCLILALQKKEEFYKYLDGYDSLALYAEKRLGAKRTLAYEYAKVGEKFYNSDDIKIRQLAEDFSPSLLMLLLRLDNATIISAYENGVISKLSTAHELRDFAKSIRE